MRKPYTIQYYTLSLLKNTVSLENAWNQVAKATLICFILLLGNIDFLSAQVVLENTSTSTTLSTPAIVSHATGAGFNRLMLVSVSFQPNSGQTVTGITYGGTPLNLVTTRTNGTNASVCLYSLVNPASGTANVSVTFSSNPTNGAIIGVTTFTGVDQISPLNGSGNAVGLSTNPTINIASTVGDLVFDAVAVKTSIALTEGAGQTERWDLNSSFERGAASTKAGAATTTMSWTSTNDDWAIVAVSIKPNITNFTLNPTKDNTLLEEGGRVDRNYGNGLILLVDKEASKLQRALLQFDLSSIPSNATIYSATLAMKKIGGDNSTQNIEVHRITAAGNWDEGTGSDVGVTGASNWTERQSGVNWGTAGGDYNGTVESTVPVSTNGTYNWTVTSLVQNWVNGTNTNYGLMLLSPDGGGDRSQDLGSSENTGNEPVLTIQYIILPTPGGVSGASIWLKADQGVTTGATLTWADQSGNNRNGVQSTATNQPTVSSTAFNFNPALTFDGTNDYLSVQNLAGLPTGATQVQQFAVANNLNIPGNFQHIFTYGTGTLGRSFGLAKQNGTGNAATVLYSQDAISSSGEFSGGELALLDGKYTGTNVVISSFGVQRITQAYSSNRTTAFGYVGVDPTLALTTCWNGNIPEIILYPTNLTAAEVNRVNSYLAIKYGITLNQTTAQNYIGSDGTIIYWNGTTNSGYRNKIAGIARDDASAINQKQSKRMKNKVFF